MTSESWKSRGGEVRVTDPVTGGQKGSKPERFSLIPWDALEEVARCYAAGAKKYSDHNWSKGYKWSLSADALGRHFSRWMQGEDIDQETQVHHLACVAFHALTLIAFHFRGAGTDDRPVSMRSAGAPVPLYGRLGTVANPTTVTRSSFFDDPEEVK